MNDITGKRTTLRYAEAEGFVYCQKETIQRIKTNTLPKGDLFEVAKASALLGAKKNVRPNSTLSSCAYRFLLHSI